MPEDQADANYPYDNGGIGIWGFDPRTGGLINPGSYTDIMGYCDPVWVSDFTVKAIANQLQVVNGLPGASFKPLDSSVSVDNELAQPWLVAYTGKRGLRWGRSIDKAQAPFGEPEQASVFDAQGAQITEVTVYVATTSEGSVTILVPKPQVGWHRIQFVGRNSLLFGQSN